MRNTIVRYRVKPDHADHNAELVRAVFEELRATGPAGVSYSTFRLEDGVSFVHVFSAENGQNPLPELAAFKDFQAGLRDRCEEGPLVTAGEPVGSYRG